MEKLTHRFLSCFLLVCLLMAGYFTALENERDTLEDYTYVNLPDPFDSSVEFREIEKGIQDFIRSRDLGIEVGSGAYVDLMYSFLYGEIDNISAITERYFCDYASVYIYEVQKVSATGDSAYDIELKGTIEGAKQKNSKMESDVWKQQE